MAGGPFDGVVFNAALADKRRSQWNVVLMGSFLQNGNVRQPAYAMSKAALWSWMRSLTGQQAIDDPVTMNMIWPGRVLMPATPMRELPTGDPNSSYTSEYVAEVVLRYL